MTSETRIGNTSPFPETVEIVEKDKETGSVLTSPTGFYTERHDFETGTTLKNTVSTSK